jgi:hypothetical protein
MTTRTLEEMAALQDDEQAMLKRLGSVVEAINTHEDAIQYDENRLDFLEEIESHCRASLDALRFEMGKKAACLQGRRDPP